jgi:hypothetical protein
MGPLAALRVLLDAMSMLSVMLGMPLAMMTHAGCNGDVKMVVMRL